MPRSTIAVTGASGFVGRHLVRELLHQGYAVKALVRDAARASRVLPQSPALSLTIGHVLDADIPQRLLRDTSACINLIGILREAPAGQTFQRLHVDATRALASAASSLGVRRFLQMSALGVRDDAPSAYQRSKWDAECLLRDSTLDYTIFRPGLIHGVGSEFLEMVKGFASGLEPPFFFLPYFTRDIPNHHAPLAGGSTHIPRVAPVAVEDVAKAFVSAIPNPATIGETYNLVGPETLDWPTLLSLVRDHTGGNHALKPWGIPASLASHAAAFAAALGAGRFLPFDQGMPIMASEDSTADATKAKAHLNLDFAPFSSRFRQYAPQLA